MKKVMSLVLSAILATGMLAGCGGGSSDDANASNETNGESAATSDIVVGFSTGAAGTTFRQEGIDDFTAIAEEYKAEGRIRDYKSVNNTTNWESNEQAISIRDFTSDGVTNCIVVNNNSPTTTTGV